MGPSPSRHVRAGPRRARRLFPIRGGRGLVPIRWGLLTVVATAHAAGLVALYGLGGPRLAASLAVPPPTISVRLVAPDPAVAAPDRVADPAPEPALASPSAAPQRENVPRPAQPAPRTTRRAAPARSAPSVAAPTPAPVPPVAESVGSPVSEKAREESLPVLPAPVAPTTSPSTAGTLAERAGDATHTAPVAKETGPPLVAASFDPAYLHNPTPIYPAVSRRRGEQGRVVLRVEVRADGRAGVIDITESSGHERLDAAARDTVRAWRFVPARRGDAALDSWLRVPIVFRLDQ